MSEDRHDPGASGYLVGPLVFKTSERLYQQLLVGSIPIRSRPRFFPRLDLGLAVAARSGD